MNSKQSRLLLMAGSAVFGLILSACVPNSYNSAQTQPHAASVIDIKPFIKTVAYTPTKKTEIFSDFGFSFSQNSSIWDRARRNFQIDYDANRPEIKKYIRYYQKHQKQLSRTLKHSEPFIYMIVHELEKRGMPGELALLPIIESAYNPQAHSAANATGLWQIMPATGRHLGLKTDYFYDGRKDVNAATDAALNYLSYLNKFFHGDWEKAIAAYNTGEGNVRKAVRRNRKRGLGTDFWSLRVAKETRDYVPNLLALATIFKNPERYGISLYHIPNKAYLTTVQVDSNINFQQAAQLTEMSVNELYKLNPGFNRWAKHASHGYELLIPIYKASTFNSNLNSANSKNMYLAKLKKPSATKSKTSAPTASNQKTIHVVHRGESLWTISHKYNVSWRKISVWNALSPHESIYPGQRLVIWTAA